MNLLHRYVPITVWATHYDRRDLRSDVVAGITICALLIPQGLAYALLAGLPAQVGLYASIAPVIAYAIFGTSRQLAVGPVAVVSLMTGTALARLYEPGSTDYIKAAGVLALLVGLVHLVVRVGRLGFVTNFLSHSVLVGFTAASAVIIIVSQLKHLLGVSVPRSESVLESARETLAVVGETNGNTLLLSLVTIAAIVAIKRWAKGVPATMVVMVLAIVAVKAFRLDDYGIKTVGEIPNSLPSFAIPSIDTGAIGQLLPAAVTITLVGFIESISVAKVYARRHGYTTDANQELIALGAANAAAGVFSGYPVTGGFSRTAVSDNAGTKTPLASIIAALLIIPAVLFLTPYFSALPQAVLAATIVVAVINLIDVAEMRHIVHVKPTDGITLAFAFFATLILGIDVGIGVAVVVSMLVVFARMSKPHTTIEGRLPGTTSYRNIERFPEAETHHGVRVVRIDAAWTFVNADHLKRLCIDHAEAISEAPNALVLNCMGINDIDATGVESLSDVLAELDKMGIALHLAFVKGPVRDVLRRANIWDQLREGERVHPTVDMAVSCLLGESAFVEATNMRAVGLDEIEPEPSSAAVP